MDLQISYRACPDLTEEQWHAVEPLFHEVRFGVPRRGRPAHCSRAVFEAIHWVLWTGAVWAHLPKRYPDYRTCHRRFKGWFEAGRVQQAMQRLYGDEGMALCAAMSERMQAWRAPSGRKPRFAVSPGLRWPLARP
jgi:transposase